MGMIFDGLKNLVSGMGTARDKGGQAEYYLPYHDPLQLLTAYRASSLVRRVVDLPAEDACREWREWQAEAADISAVEAEEARLGLQGKVLEARRQARLFGGAAILIGTGDTEPTQPLRPDTIRKGGIKYLTVLTFADITAGDIGRDPAEPDFGRPTYWQMTTATGGTVFIHPSRLVIFHGIPPMNNLGYESISGWGDSVLPGMLEAVKRVDEVAGNVLSLIYEAKIDVIKIPDLMMNLQQRGAAYESEVLRRMSLAATGKGINGTLIIDALEEYEQKSASFGGLPDILDRFCQLASAASGIPMTLLFGMSPGGLNATGDADIRAYYDRVKVQQSLAMQPAMAVLDECLIRSALGDRPDDLHYTWRPLWQTTAGERAENANNLMSALEKLYRMDVLAPEAIGAAAVNGLTESGAFPGLEGYVAEYPGGDDDDDLDVVRPGEAIGDAAPRTLYVRRDVLNAAEIIAWAKAQGFNTTLPADDMHVTIAFSRAPVDWMKMGETYQEQIEVSAGGARLMEQFGEARVLLFNASELAWRHEDMKRGGATWDHPEYQPHITISYDPDAPDLADVQPYKGKIILGPEIFQEVKEDWQEGIAEE